MRALKSCEIPIIVGITDVSVRDVGTFSSRQKHENA